MSVSLNIGTRVWLCWTPSENVIGCTWLGDPRLKTGTVIDGPLGPGRHVGTHSGTLYVINGYVWVVQIDNGHQVTVSENLLHPIDDGEPATHENEKEATP